jgi:hypothetical protein
MVVLPIKAPGQGWPADFLQSSVLSIRPSIGPKPSLFIPQNASFDTELKHRSRVINQKAKDCLLDFPPQDLGWQEAWVSAVQE